MTCSSCGARRRCIPCKGMDALTRDYERHHRITTASRKEALAHLHELARANPEIARVVDVVAPLLGS